MKKKVYKTPKVDCREIGLTPILAASTAPTSYGFGTTQSSGMNAKSRNFGAADFDF